MNASSLAEDIGASLWTAIDNVYGTLIRKSDVFDIINTVVFEIEKRALCPLPQSDDPGELSQKLGSVAILSRNGTVSSNPAIPTADIPEYQGFLRLLSPTPTLWEEDIQTADFTTPGPRITSETPASKEPLTRLYPAAPGIPHTTRISKKSKRRRRKSRRNQKGSQKATRLMPYPESLTIYFGNSL
ncbi:hypothetical protein TWF106_004298 [Orbilia oligospora]|uniref:Uncharacterized protein n=1 Tax=Orbilia oligospora TaxID=2813651 RepID=A0A6G1MQE6_ORBOL|nr:hypothetical protein TWF191_009108 [Orbilia oligospora]KAF3216800.1 hypothetical protein TWF679_002646 [Orbilia oligospora]KAF3229379.1 hypothetical protein TWF106_004298 [Orbilia oligospora]KAF3264408.1 hypothetical protein TWF192_004094 [Orbilia oligospora]